VAYTRHLCVVPTRERLSSCEYRHGQADSCWFVFSSADRRFVNGGDTIYASHMVVHRRRHIAMDFIVGHPHILQFPTRR
jgi:hypothetical protein